MRIGNTIRIEGFSHFIRHNDATGQPLSLLCLKDAVQHMANNYDTLFEKIMELPEYSDNEKLVLQ